MGKDVRSLLYTLPVTQNRSDRHSVDQNDLYDSDDSLRKLSEIAASDGANKNRESKPGAGQVIDDRSLPPRTQAGKVFGRRSKGVGQGKGERREVIPACPLLRVMPYR
jgi:hypothetical protein